jgi:hypothetical protein
MGAERDGARGAGSSALIAAAHDGHANPRCSSMVRDLIESSGTKESLCRRGALPQQGGEEQRRDAPGVGGLATGGFAYPDR